MAITRKPIGQQVLVITGATSGIGLTTARMAAREGARLVLFARNEEQLRTLGEEIRSRGGEAVWVAGDVADPGALERLASAAIEAFGGFDTWVNNAGVSIYGRLDEVPLHEKRRLFDVTFWGVVHGCRAALPHLRERGGVIINIGSIVSERAMPLQGMYSAAKHAVKGYTEALRMELEQAKVPVAVTLIKPTAIDTPFINHARNHLSSAPKLPAPVYAPETVARAILACAVRPRRDVLIGGGAKAISLMEKAMPRATDMVMEKTMFAAQESGEQRPQEDALFNTPAQEGEQRSGRARMVQPRSLYTDAALHPLASLALAAGVGLLGWGLWSSTARTRSRAWRDYTRRATVLGEPEIVV